MPVFVKLKDGVSGELLRQDGSNILVTPEGDATSIWYPAHAIDYMEVRGELQLEPGESGVASITREGEIEHADDERTDQHRDGGQ